MIWDDEMDNFIFDLDQLYIKEKIESGISEKDKKYILFRPIVIEQDGIVNSLYVIRKQEFTKYLYCKNGVRVYFTDADILEMLLQLENAETVDEIIRGLIAIYNNGGEQFSFIIDGKKYEAIGLPVIKNNQILKNNQDVDISFEDLLFLVNIILAKDKASIKLWKGEPDFQRQTIVKYVVLLKYYYYGDDNSKNYLQQKGYDINSKIHQNYDTGKKRTKINKIFYDFDLFESLNLM